MGRPHEMLYVIQRALEFSALSRGAFDITVKPLMDLYTSSFARTGAPPPESRVQQRLSRVGYQNVLVDYRSVAFEKGGMSVTLDGIAKGYIVDRAIEVLKENWAEPVLVDAGGDMGSLSDEPSSESWKIAIHDPRHMDRSPCSTPHLGPFTHDPDHSLGILQLQGQSVATSGDYNRYFTEDKRFHHILDPRTGRSPDHTSAVTVVAPKAMGADDLATAVLVLGPQDGLQLLNQLEGVEGMIVTKEQDVLRSRGLSHYTA